MYFPNRPVTPRAVPSVRPCTPGTERMPAPSYTQCRPTKQSASDLTAGKEWGQRRSKWRGGRPQKNHTEPRRGGEKKKVHPRPEAGPGAGPATEAAGVSPGTA